MSSILNNCPTLFAHLTMEQPLQQAVMQVTICLFLFSFLIFSISFWIANPISLLLEQIYIFLLLASGSPFKLVIFQSFTFLGFMMAPSHLSLKRFLFSIHHVSPIFEKNLSKGDAFLLNMFFLVILICAFNFLYLLLFIFHGCFLLSI